TTSSASSTFTGNATYPVFPNANYISLFYLSPSDEFTITNLDTDLYNRCYLPANPLPYSNAKRDSSWISITISNPDYDIDEAPCKRQAAINANCHFRNGNGTAAGLQVYTDDFEEQRECYCNEYPFFDAVVGCQKCFEMHGGIEGYHYFPYSYISAFADSYCSSSAPPTKEFYAAALAWKATAAEAVVPSTTAKDVLGTQTDARLYYTANADVKAGAVKSSG
ncbi:hypothetical protein K491DRAFT_556411, partial [Lophiostoma macrostomum CBS 122681]